MLLIHMQQNYKSYCAALGMLLQLSNYNFAISPDILNMYEKVHPQNICWKKDPSMSVKFPKKCMQTSQAHVQIPAGLPTAITFSCYNNLPLTSPLY